ncbi:MAG: hypothetical protein AB1657_01230 [Candidatus Micrarchaeota archaeon]
MDWMQVSLVVVLLSFSLSAVMIMLSRLFQNKNLEQWAKAEMIFAFSTFLLVVFFYGLFSFGQGLLLNAMKQILIANYAQQGMPLTMDDFDRAFPLGENQAILGLSELYMNKTYSCLRDIGRVTYALASPLFFAESFSKDAFMTDTGTGWGLKPFTQTAMNIINYVVFTAFLFLVFLHILKFISAFALPVFFPAGILLRAFPPTRGAGAYVLAFVAGFYFVFPAAYLLAVNLSMNPFYCGVPEPPAAPGMCNINSPGQPEKVFLWANKVQQEAMSDFEQLRNAVAGVMVNLLCLPFIAMVITMSFILSSTNLFGANLPEVGRGFVKLI